VANERPSQSLLYSTNGTTKTKQLEDIDFETYRTKVGDITLESELTS
jgi:hypothetical protein